MTPQNKMDDCVDTRPQRQRVLHPRMLRHEMVGQSAINTVSTYLGGASEIVF